MKTTGYLRARFAMPTAILICVAGAAGGQTPKSAGVPGSEPVGELERILASRPIVNQKLTREGAVAIALSESPIVRGAVEEVQAAAGKVNAARAETRPWVSLNSFASGGSNSNIVTSPIGTQPQMIMALPRDAFFDQNIMLMVPLYSGGRLSAMVRHAAALRSASEADLAAQRQEIALMTSMAYREVLARRSLVTVAGARLTANQERRRVDQNRFEAGSVPLLTVQRDDAEVAAARQDVENAVRDGEIALVNLKTVMGVHPGSKLDLIDTTDYVPSASLIDSLMRTAGAVAGTSKDRSTGSALPQDLAALLRLAERSRPEMRAAAQRVQGANAAGAAARSAYLPQVNLFAMGDLQGSRGANGFAGTTFGLAASLPLYNGGERRAQVQTADAERRRLEQERQRTALVIAQDVITALLNLRAAEQNILTSRKALESAQEGYRTALERYQAGRSVNVEVLDALAARTQAQSNEVQALFQYDIAYDRLLHSVGAAATEAVASN